MKETRGLPNLLIIILICIILILMVIIIYISQYQAERNALPSVSTPSQSSILKQEYEISKLAAEIKKIRSDTAGSLFWLKLIGLFVTVGGAIGGYLFGQSRSTRAKIDFENRKNVDSAYQSIVLELSDDSTILRAAAAVKLGTILKSFPSEWVVSNRRRNQLIQLTKQVIAAALAIETNEKVLKTLTINLILHQPNVDNKAPEKKRDYADARELDLSGAKAADAYWAKVDFSYSDFYKADLSKTSFRGSFLSGAQFRESVLSDAVLAGTNCERANFKLADLRNADLTGANLLKVNFEGAKVSGLILSDAVLGDNPETMVDISPEGDGSKMMNLKDWLSSLKL